MGIMGCGNAAKAVATPHAASSTCQETMSMGFWHTIAWDYWRWSDKKLEVVAFGRCARFQMGGILQSDTSH